MSETLDSGTGHGWTYFKGVDGVVFVVDSQVERLDANLEAVDEWSARF